MDSTNSKRLCGVFRCPCDIDLVVTTDLLLGSIADTADFALGHRSPLRRHRITHTISMDPHGSLESILEIP